MVPGRLIHFTELRWGSGKIRIIIVFLLLLIMKFNIFDRVREIMIFGIVQVSIDVTVIFTLLLSRLIPIISIHIIIFLGEIHKEIIVIIRIVAVSHWVYFSLHSSMMRIHFICT